MRIASTLFTLVLASTALAQMHVVPAGPTSATPIELHYVSDCLTNTHTVQREGSRILVTADGAYCGLPHSQFQKKTVQLTELLPPGEYQVEVRMGSNSHVSHSMEFVVRNAAVKPFEVHPWVVGSPDLPIRLHGVDCDQPNCADISIFVDDQEIESFTVDDQGAIWFDTPQHEPGLADVMVQKDDFASVSPGALYFLDRPADPSLFEPILFPVLFGADGAHGSKWRTEAVISNPRPWYVENANSLGPLAPCITFPCGDRYAPREIVKLSDGFPRGALLFAPRPEAPDLAFSLRVRDISRESTTLGTRIPVVRERDLFHDEDILLLDVPLDPRYRVKVRIYAVSTVFSLEGGTVLTDEPTPRGGTFVLARTRDDGPSYAEVDLPVGAAGERRDVWIDMPLEAIGWAFASVTNNETQQVTIVTPNR